MEKNIIDIKNVRKCFQDNSNSKMYVNILVRNNYYSTLEDITEKTIEGSNYDKEICIVPTLGCYKKGTI